MTPFLFNEETRNQKRDFNGSNHNFHFAQSSFSFESISQ